ncbi:MAG: endonuclease/exonuclease/phosphatase family protein [Bacteroidia bacterium]
MNRILIILLLSYAMLTTSLLNAQPALKLMTFNIRLNTARDSANAWPKRTQLVESMIDFYAPDLLGVQEALPDQMEDLKRMLPKFISHGIARDTGKWGEYSAIFYRSTRLSLEEGGTFWLSETPEKPSKGWDAALNRIATWGIFRDKRSGERFLYLNTHFDHRGSKAREESAKLLLAQAKALNPEGLPVLLSGDFNFTPQRTPYQILTADDAFLDGRLESLTAAHGPASTWSGFEFPGVPERRIDYIFGRGAVHFMRYATLTDSWSGRYPSDHLPVMAEVLINPAPVLLQAHAHNDYEHTRPLLDALSQGFNSVEADVWWWNDKLIVKHNQPAANAATPDLRTLYLEPLAQIAAQNYGRIYPQSDEPFWLMIDLKNEGDQSYRALSLLLQEYHWMLEGDNPALRIFLSGNRPIDLASIDLNRIMGIDGRPEDLGRDYSTDFMPVISQRYGKLVNWGGRGEIPAKEREKLQMLVDQAHAEGKRVRLWASPETEIAWKTLLDIGVDMINTDDLEGLRRFMLR